MFAKHHVLEKNSLLLLVCTLIVVSIGGIVEIAPLFYLDSTIEKVEGMRPYSCLLYTSPSPRDRTRSRMPSSA